MAAVPIEDYKDAMRETICSICVSFVEDAENPTHCVYENSGQCSLFAHLPDIVDAVSGVHSGAIEPYTIALREKVCAHCDHQDQRGVCNLRDNRGPTPTWCVLDAYFNLVAGAIEEVQQRHQRPTAT
jgi:hypothetical protein